MHPEVTPHLLVRPECVAKPWPSSVGPRPPCGVSLGRSHGFGR